LNSLLPGFKNLKLQLEPKPRFFIEKNSTRLPLEQLSDGERGLIALAFDLTRRLALANPESENPIIEGKASVLIDEIELHLHPLWQRQVLNRLKEIFANCQFIATTHSPLVLGEVEARCVRFLDRDDLGRVFCTVPNEAYGMDANRVLEELMGARVRTREMDDQLKVLFQQIDNEDFDAARQTMNALREKLGEHDPELTRASSLIKFLKGEA
jgi:predicted ATP-binding protein involved in virulence